MIRTRPNRRMHEDDGTRREEVKRGWKLTSGGQDDSGGKLGEEHFCVW